MAEVNNSEEQFDPNKITKEGDELKRAYFEANQDIKELKHKHAKEIASLKEEFEQFKKSLQDKTEKKKEETELEKLLLEYKEKAENYEKQLNEILPKLKEYEKQEEEKKRAIEQQKNEILELFSEEERELYRPLELEALKKLKEKLKIEPKESKIDEGGKTKEVPSEKEKLSTELINQTPDLLAKETLLSNPELIGL